MPENQYAKAEAALHYSQRSTAVWPLASMAVATYD